MKRAKVARKDKPRQPRYAVVRADDAQGKYLPVPGADGFTQEHAERLAAPVAGQPAYQLIPIEVHQWAQEVGAEGTPAELQVAYQMAKGDA